MKDKKYSIILIILRIIHNWETILGTANFYVQT